MVKELFRKQFLASLVANFVILHVITHKTLIQIQIFKCNSILK